MKETEMAQNFKIDQVGTFVEPPMLLQCLPKTKFGSDVQDTTKDGKPKWEAHLICFFRGFGGAPAPEIIKVGFVGVNPSDGIMPSSKVIVDGLEVGVMEKTKRNPDTGEERIIGLTVWYRAEAMHPAEQRAAAPAQKAA
jgi:hypothetical protein